MDFENKQIPPPRNWEVFEELCLALWQGIWSDPHATKNGRRGQQQAGVDIVGRLQGSKGLCGVQCKGKDQGYGSLLSLQELESEVAKAECFAPPLAHYVIATTAVRDAVLQRQVRELSAVRTAAGRFPVDVLAWEDIQSLIGRHRPVLERFYPEHSADAQALLAELRNITAAAAPPPQWPVEAVSAGWNEVEFSADRDLGPALLGRGLGPADALACPRLHEADTLVSELVRAFSVRLSGMPGAGKSVCCYQAAATLAAQGWTVKALNWPPPASVALPSEPGGTRVLYIIDDAHRLPLGTIDRLEHQAGTSRFVLSTFNAAELGGHGQGIVLDEQRAVKTISASLRTDTRLLEVVKRVDDRVGDGYMDEDLAERIDAAEREANYPWQFCFVLGGGWRRSARMADACRVNGATYAAASIALLQLVTRDKGASLPVLDELLSPAGVSQADVRRHLEWLVAQRLVISHRDLRTPHQRFAVALLRSLGHGISGMERRELYALCRRVVTHPESTLGGIRLLASELRFGEHSLDPRLWNREVQDQLKARCFAAELPEDRMFASLYLAEQHGVAWPERISKNISLLGRWISEAVHPAGHGLHMLINNIYNDDKDLARQLVCASDALQVAKAVSSVTLETAWSCFEMVDRMALAGPTEWQQQFVGAIDKPRLLAELARWDDLERGVLVASTGCWALAMHDRQLGWQILEAVLPLLQQAFAKHPVRAFRLSDKIIFAFLRVWNPLGIGPAPDKRQRQAVRAILKDLDVQRTAREFSSYSVRELHDAAHFIGFLDAANARLATKLLAGIDLDAVATTIGRRWEAPDHDTAIFLSQFSRDDHNRRRLQDLMLARVQSITRLPCRLALVCPAVAVQVVEKGGRVELGQEMSLGWDEVAMVIYQVGKISRATVRPMLTPHLPQAVENWQSKQVNLYENIDMFICVFEQYDLADIVRETVDRLDPSTITQFWPSALRHGGLAARSVSLLLEYAAMSELVPLREAAEMLQSRFPASKRRAAEARTKYVESEEEVTAKE